MISFPNCKINLGLKVLRRREDGYHDLETVFYPLPLKDVLETIRSESLQFTATGLPIPGDPATNLCCKAWYLLKKDFPALPPVHIYLHKHIPMGAGLGGGSSDGAAMLQLLDRQGQLQLGTERLLQYALELGSDCPFFILNQPCLGGGRGEVLQPVGLDLSGYSFVIVHPGIHIGTAWAFSQVAPVEGGTGPDATRARARPDRERRVGEPDSQGGWEKPIAEVIRQPIGTWAAELVNDFEAPVLREYPALRSVKEQLYGEGALYASMTGSGSSFFGIFAKGAQPVFRFDPDFHVSRVDG